jgi:hypothetical protein
MARLNADLSNYSESTSYEALPPGWYQAIVEDSEIRTGPKGEYINWTFQLIGNNKKVWDIMSLSNKISMERLKSLAIACQHKNPNFISDTEELHGEELMIKLKIQEDEKYGTKNSICGFRTVNSKKPIDAKKKTSTEEAKLPWNI